MRFDDVRNRIHSAILRAGRKGICSPDIAKKLRLPRHTRVSPRASELRHQGKVGVRGTTHNPESGEPNGRWVAAKYLSRLERRHEQKVRELWELRRRVNRRFSKLSLEKKIALTRAFLRDVSR